jgi:hypothetical protein
VKLKEFGEPAAALGWHRWRQQTLSDAAGVLATLTDREVDRMDRINSPVFGKGALAVRLDLIEKARELIEVAEAGDPCTMRKLHAVVCKR